MKNLLMMITMLGVFSGIALGFSLRSLDISARAISLIAYPGELYMRILKLLILPLIISSLISATASLNAAMGVILAVAIHPGHRGLRKGYGGNDERASKEDRPILDSLLDLGRNVAAENIFQATFQQAYTEYVNTTVYTFDERTEAFNSTVVLKANLTYRLGTNTLGIVFFCLTFGTLLGTSGPKARVVVDFFSATFDVVLKMVYGVTWTTPVGVCSLICGKILSVDDVYGATVQLGWFILTVSLGVMLYQLVIMQMIYLVLVKKNPYRYYFALAPGALDLLVRKAHLLIENENNNRAERLMNIVSRFNQGKRLNLIQRGSYQRRVHLSGLRYNKQSNWHYDPYKNIMGRSPGKHFKKFVAQNWRSQELKCHKRLFPTTTNANDVPKKKVKKDSNWKSVNTDYGPHADQQIIEPTLLAKEVDVILERLQITESERDRIQSESIGQFGNPIFESERRLRLTASIFGKVIKRRPYTPCHNMVKECLKTNHFWSEATDYGIAKEKVAIGIFEQLKNLKVKDSGFWVDIQYGFLGASPDGIVLDEDAIVEVKCIYSASKLELKTNTIEEVINLLRSKMCLEIHNNQIRLKRNHNYFYQVQGQLNITQKSKCYFIVYINDTIELFVEVIERDTKFWENKMCPILIQFYKECIVPEIIMNNLGKGRRCEDPPYIAEAIASHTTKTKETLKRKKSTKVDIGNNKENVLRSVVVPVEVINSFQRISENNTLSNIESCGILTGLLKNDELVITHLILPKQTGTSDSCTASHEEEILEYQEIHNLITLGWIHTHPTQTAFLSSVDLHTHCSYQILMPEAIAIVCAPNYKQSEYFNLSEYGVQLISNCKKSGFHAHPIGPQLFKVADHVRIENDATLNVIDLRNT